jgi:hypothetical protein
VFGQPTVNTSKRTRMAEASAHRADAVQALAFLSQIIAGSFWSASHRGTREKLMWLPRRAQASESTTTPFHLRRCGSGMRTLCLPRRTATAALVRHYG